MIDTFYDHIETILETLFETIYIFLWIWYVNVCFFKYNRRIQDLELEIVGLRRIVYSFMNEKTKTNTHQLLVYNRNKYRETDEKIMKLKKGIIFLKKNMDHLTTRIENLEESSDTHTSTSSCCTCTCSDDGSTSDGDFN